MSEKLKVVIEVSGGCASVASCPDNVEVEIIDHDDMEVDYEDGYDYRWENPDEKMPTNQNESWEEGWKNADDEIKAEMNTPTPE